MIITGTGEAGGLNVRRLKRNWRVQFQDGDVVLEIGNLKLRMPDDLLNSDHRFGAFIFQRSVVLAQRRFDFSGRESAMREKRCEN